MKPLGIFFDIFIGLSPLHNVIRPFRNEVVQRLSPQLSFFFCLPPPFPWMGSVLVVVAAERVSIPFFFHSCLEDGSGWHKIPLRGRRRR